MRNKTALGLRPWALAALGIALTITAATQAQQRRMPVFEVDASWPKLPNNWVLGQTPGIAVDRRDHVYLLHRPRTVPEELRSRAAPAVLEFDEKGAFVTAWGGPGNGFDWPDSSGARHRERAQRRGDRAIGIGGRHALPLEPALQAFDDAPHGQIVTNLHGDPHVRGLMSV